ncbi:radical SAM family heme chaperone HemW [Acidithiobacillus sp. M4-SHS-6]|uniref:radical SAM family heme chaperone HemW n=1 Tax=Acidithiobacillus sp. M4-SHS-6 TaxID=3383024 RepID=UPI0039BDE459
MNSSLKPSSTFSLYVHLPWCKAKCPYCDFNSHAAEQIPAERYAQALIADLDRELPRIWGRRLRSIFMGGGTPSLFPPEIIHQLLSDIRARLQPLSGMEVTLEANPGAVEAAAFGDFRAAGVTRLSLGIQSFNNIHLQRLGRIHNAAAAHRAIEKAIAAQFTSLNLDLMFALPGQNAEEALADLHTALQYQPPHLSLYQLTLEAGTPFASHPPAWIPDEDTAADMENRLRDTLEQHGLPRYEISAHARPEEQCQHNRNYWLYGDYLGIGAGAHGKITQAEGIWRSRKPSRPESYMDDALSNRETLGDYIPIPAEERPFEFMLNALRLTEGFPVRLFTERTGLDSLLIEPQIRRARREGLLLVDAKNIRPTARGLNFYNELCARFLP